MSKVSEYRQHARECRSLAKTARFSQHREILLNMAAAWDLGDSFGLFPFVHGDPLANQFDGPFLVRLIRKEVTHISGFPFGIESRDPDIPSCWHSGTMRRSCCCQANPLPTNDTPASDIPQRFQCPAMLGDGGVGNRKVRYRSARIPSPPSRGGALRALHSSLEHAR